MMAQCECKHTAWTGDPSLYSLLYFHPRFISFYVYLAGDQVWGATSHTDSIQGLMFCVHFCKNLTRVKLHPHTFTLFVFRALRSHKHVPQQVSQLLIVEIQQLKGVNLWRRKERTHDPHSTWSNSAPHWLDTSYTVTITAGGIREHHSTEQIKHIF